jgi:membrane associated rhomboid family serine protease
LGRKSKRFCRVAPRYDTAVVVLYVLLALNIAFSIVIAIDKKSIWQLVQADPPLLVRWGGMYAPFVRRGQYWRLASAMFLHSNIQHLSLNTAALIAAGALALERLGEPLLVTTYLASGVAGFVVSYLRRRNRAVRDTGNDHATWKIVVRAVITPNPFAVCVGASGAICGLIAAAGVDAQLHGDHETRDAMARWLAVILVYGLVPGVDNAAHVGGALAGAAIGAVGGQPGLEVPVMALAPVVVAALLLWIARSRGEGDTVDRWTRRAADARKANDLDTAIAAYEQALALHDRNAVVTYNLALALEQRGDLAGALRRAEHAVAIDHDDRDTVALRNRLARAIEARDRPAR